MKRWSFFSTALACLLAGAPLAAGAQSRADGQGLPLPLTGPAFQIADQAYRAYELGNYAEAIRNAQEAIRLRPDVPRLQTLLRMAQHAQRQRLQPAARTQLAGAGGQRGAAQAAGEQAEPWFKQMVALQDKEQYAAALELAERGLRTPGAHAALLERRGQLRGQLAQQYAAKAVAAEQRGEADAALAAVVEAVTLAPDVPQYRLLLVKLRIQAGDYAGAYTTAKQAVALDSDDAMAQAYAAYLLQRRGERGTARALFRKAGRSDALGDADLRNLRLIGADAALAAGDSPAALDALTSLPDSDPEVLERRRLAQEIAAASTAFRPELTPPALRCVVNRFGPVCSLFPGSRPSQVLAAGAYRAAASQRLPEALALLDDAQRIGGATPELSAQKDATRRMVARQHAAAAFQAMADNQVALAQREIGKATEFAPEVIAYRMMLIDILARQQRYPQAASVADQAIAADPEDVAPLAMRGYVRQLQGNVDAARGDYRAALKGTLLSDADRRELSLFIADAALAGGDPALLDEALAGLPANDVQAAWRRRLAWAGAARPALLAPNLDYRGTPYETVCTVQPSADAPNMLVEAIYHAIGNHEDMLAVVQARQLLALAPDNQNYQRILAQALDSAGQREEATRITAGLRDPVPGLDLAYLAQSARAPQLANATFQQIDAAGRLPDRALQDAGFAALNANDRRRASTYFRRTVDAARAGAIELTPQQLYEVRRAVAEVDRQWGFNVSLSYRGANPESGPAATNRMGDTLQSSEEIYWRPERFNQNGRYIDLYGRVNATPYANDDTSSTGASTVLAALGVRGKPLASQNLILAFERLVPLGAATEADWLARAAYSYGYGTDLRVDVPSWNTAQVYAEAGRYLHQGSDYFTSEGQLGRSYIAPLSWPKNTILMPHIVLAADYNQGFAEPEAIGAGVGLTLRYWFREDRYNAPRSSFDLTTQYRFRLSGDDRAGGLVVRATLNY